MTDELTNGVEPVSRRRMFRWLRGAATTGAGAVVVGSMLDSSSVYATGTPANAAEADGDALSVGRDNVNSSEQTKLSGSLGNPIFSVNNSSTDGSPIALFGDQSGASQLAGTGVLGSAVGLFASGVRGVAGGLRGVGVRASSTFNAALLLDPSGTAMPPITGQWEAGSFVVYLGHVWYCFFGGVGSASKWVRLSSTFVPLASPARVYDSRGGLGPLATGQQRAVTVLGTFTGTTIPAGISAVLTNLTCAGPTGSGYLAMFKDGTSWTGTSNVNFVAGVNVANNATSAVSAGGNVSVLCGGGGATDFVVDVFGYYL